MTHGDDDGIILPPRVASSHVVFMPDYPQGEGAGPVMELYRSPGGSLKTLAYGNRKLQVEIDDRDIGGARGWEWIKKGIPLRVEIGPRDMAENSVYVGRRDQEHGRKKSIKRDVFVKTVTDLWMRSSRTCLIGRRPSGRRIPCRSTTLGRFMTILLPGTWKNPKFTAGLPCPPGAAPTSVKRK